MVFIFLIRRYGEKRVYRFYNFTPPGCKEYRMRRVEPSVANESLTSPDHSDLVIRKNKFIRQKSTTRIEVTPATLFVRAYSLPALTVQQSIYRLGDPNQSLSSPIIFRDNYVLSFDERMRNPKWVFEKITKTELEGDASRKNCDFKQDLEIHEFFRAQNTDYKGSGYDRGHLAAAANHTKSPTVLQETFLLSNICPQHPGLNRKMWKRLEGYTRSLAKQYESVYVCSGPLYLPKQKDDRLIVEYQLLGSQHIAVPTHFFKIILMESKGRFGKGIQKLLFQVHF